MNKYSSVHASPRGPGDARPTADQIIQDEGLVGALVDKTFLVTGGTSGLGRETARALRKTGAKVFITALNAELGHKVAQDIAAEDDSGLDWPAIGVIEVDLSNLESVRYAAATFLRQSATLNALIMNAGIMVAPQGRTVDGHEQHFGVNYLAHFLLFHLLKPALLAAARPGYASRVVAVSSGTHRRTEVQFGNYNLEGLPYDPFIAYGQSKLALIYLANEIERRYAFQDLHAWSIHPGVIMENLNRDDPNIPVSQIEEQFLQANPNARQTFKSREQGAATQVWAAVGRALEGQGGRYLEDVQESQPIMGREFPGARGHLPYIYDVEKARRLWQDSLPLVDLAGDWIRVQPSL